MIRRWTSITVAFWIPMPILCSPVLKLLVNFFPNLTSSFFLLKFKRGFLVLSSSCREVLGTTLIISLMTQFLAFVFTTFSPFFYRDDGCYNYSLNLFFFWISHRSDLHAGFKQGSEFSYKRKGRKFQNEFFYSN